MSPGRARVAAFVIWAGSIPLFNTGDMMMGSIALFLSLIVAWLPPDIKS